MLRWAHATLCTWAIDSNGGSLLAVRPRVSHELRMTVQTCCQVVDGLRELKVALSRPCAPCPHIGCAPVCTPVQTLGLKFHERSRSSYRPRLVFSGCVVWISAGPRMRTRILNQAIYRLLYRTLSSRIYAVVKISIHIRWMSLLGRPRHRWKGI